LSAHTKRLFQSSVPDINLFLYRRRMDSRISHLQFN